MYVYTHVCVCVCMYYVRMYVCMYGYIVVRLCLHYNSIRSEVKKSEFLLSHCPYIDVVKFTSDIKYRTLSILSLSSSLDPHTFELSLTLSKRYNIPVFDVYMHRLSSLFLSMSNITQLKEEILNFEKHLLEKPQLFYQKLTTELFVNVKGSDLLKIQYLYSLW